jgi:hypothetical protein
MKRVILAILSMLAILQVSGQSDRNMYLGINILQLPAFTLNVNYSSEFKPFLTPIIDLGYTFNYSKSFDILGIILTPHCTCWNNGYHLSNQSGGYLKFGTFFNLRKTFEKKNYPQVGLFLTNSIVYEYGIYQPKVVIYTMPDPVQLNHTKFILGLSAMIGYEYYISKRLQSNFDFQISFPNKNYRNLYWYRNYIPGMGYKDYNGYWFPMIIWNIKYRL